VAFQDGVIDSGRQAQVIRIDDQPPHAQECSSRGRALLLRNQGSYPGIASAKPSSVAPASSPAVPRVSRPRSQQRLTRR
jgi:hypothetical protein